MPRSRHTSRQAVEFHVAPWQSKRKQHMTAAGVGATTSANAMAALSAAQTATPVTVMPDASTQPTMRSAEATRPPQLASGLRRLTTSDLHERARPYGPAAAIDLSTDIPWMSRKRPRLDFPPSAAAPQGMSPAFLRQPDAADSAAEAAQPTEPCSPSSSQEASAEDAAAAAGDVAAAAPFKLDGAAHLALLPCGALSGHLVDAGSQRCFGLLGRQVLAQSSCFRDTEWSLLRLELSDSASGACVETFVERTGGDMARLQPADCDNEDVEAAVRDCKRDEFEEADLRVLVSFLAAQLLAGDAAEAHLRRFQPRLCDRDAVVNIGSMRVDGLPAWFLT